MKYQSSFVAKFLAMFLPVLAFSILGAQLALAAGAREFEKPPCYDITGTSQPVLVDGSGNVVTPAPGVNNSGILDFDDNGVAPQYQACVRMDSFEADAKPVRVEGWVWNNNLGWISLYCDGNPGGDGVVGTGDDVIGKNLDIPCGARSYSITFALTGTGPNFTDVSMSGYAWGDNVGWITFNTAGLHQIKPTPSGLQRGLVPNAPSANKFAWAETIGWVDLSGVWFHWEDTDPPVPDPNVLKYVSVCSSKDDVALPPLSPPDNASSYSTNGNGPANSLNYYSNNLWVVNVLSRNLKRFNVNGGGPGVPTELRNFSSALPDEDYPFAMDVDGPGNRLFLVSYNPGTSFGLIGLSASMFTRLAGWATVKPIDHTWTYADIAVDSGSVSVWLAVNDNTGTGHLQKYNMTTGALVKDLSWPIGVGINQVVVNTGNNWVWVLQKDNKLVKINRVSGNFYSGAYVVVDPLMGAAEGSSELIYNAGFLWAGLKGSSQIFKLNAMTGLKIVGGTYTSPVVNPVHFTLDTPKQALWVVGGASRTGRLRITDGANMGLYPDVGVTNPSQVVVDTFNSLLWTIESSSPGNFWKVGRDAVSGFGVGDAKCNCDLDGTCLQITDDTKVPLADGTDLYTVLINFVDNGSKVLDSQIEECPDDFMDMYTYKVPGGKDYCAKISLVWEDDVHYNQTTAASQSQSDPKFSENNNGAVNKPLLADFALVPPGASWSRMVKSFAPTSDRNFFGNMQNEKFYFYDAAEMDPILGSGSGLYNPTLTDQNMLKLKGIKLLLYKYVPIGTPAGLPGTCLYGLFDKGFCKTYDFMVPSGSILSFNPVVKVDKLVYMRGVDELNYIALDNTDSPQNFKVSQAVQTTAPAGWNTNFKIGLTDASSYDLKLIDSGFPKENPEAAGVTASRDKADALLESWVGQVFTLDIAGTISNVGPYLYSKTSYTLPGAAEPTVFWGTKLPRIKASLLINPVAKIQGNVYLTDYGKKAKDVTLNSLGNISSNLRREQIYRNVQAYLKGYPQGNIKTGDVELSGPISLATLNTVLTPLVKDKVYYLRDGNLKLSCGLQCVFTSNVTFIVENGNIFVNSNIKYPSGNPQVGLIALRNLVGNKQDQGFVYVDRTVTWMKNVQIFADRLLQSYDKTTMSFTADGLWMAPVGTDDAARQEIFNNQLVIEGTLSSMNGIGNATPDPGKKPTDERGVEVTTGTYCADYHYLTGICRARSVDLNYLRYFGPGLDVSCHGGVPRDKKPGGPNCNFTDPAYDIDANGLFAPDRTSPDNGPDFDLVPGANGLPSNYFLGQTPVLANQFPVNFFYVPIAKDLGGFEVQQNLDIL